MLRYGFGVLKRMRLGIRIYAVVTYRCNLDCSYCGNKVLGVRPRMEEIGWGKWARLIDSFPARVREVVISGGEPFLYQDIGKLINHLTDRGKFVTIFSNLEMLTKKLGIRPSYRIRIGASLHESQDRARFMKAYRENRGIYRIDYDILGDKTKHIGLTTRMKKIETVEDLKADECWDEPRFIYVPNGDLYTSFEQAITRVSRNG